MNPENELNIKMICMLRKYIEKGARKEEDKKVAEKVIETLEELVEKGTEKLKLAQDIIDVTRGKKIESNLTPLEVKGVSGNIHKCMGFIEFLNEVEKLLFTNYTEEYNGEINYVSWKLKNVNNKKGEITNIKISKEYGNYQDIEGLFRGAQGEYLGIRLENDGKVEFYITQYDHIVNHSKISVTASNFVNELDAARDKKVRGIVGMINRFRQAFSSKSKDNESRVL